MTQKFDYSFDYQGEDFKYQIDYNECDGNVEDVMISITWNDGTSQVLDQTPDWAIEKAQDDLLERGYDYDDEDR